jgi:hypothetical protein
MKAARGAVDSGVPDLGSNPEHLTGFGHNARRHRWYGAAGRFSRPGGTSSPLGSRADRGAGRVWAGASWDDKATPMHVLPLVSGKPLEQLTKFDLIINVTTSKTIELKIPESFISLADEVIE